MRWRRLLLWPLAFIGVAITVLFAFLCVNAFLVAEVEDGPPPPERIQVKIDGATSRLAESIRFETLSEPPGIPADPQAFVAFHRFLETSYPRVHRALEREIVNDFSLIYRWQGSDSNERPILLIAHQDVVPPNGEWSRPPFSGLVEDDFIWGRGSLDDKVSMLGILEAVELLLEAGFEPRRTIYLAFGHDEEISGKNGAQAIARLFRERGIHFSFVLDEGSPIGVGLVPRIDRPVALIGTAEKGYLSVELNARTSGGHSSMPSRASAIRVMGEALIKLLEHADRGSLNPPFTDSLEALAPHLDFFARIVVANHWLFEPILVDQLMQLPETQAMISSTGTVTVIEGGQVDNVMPSHARAVVNFRLLPGTTVEAQLARIRSLIDDPAISVEQLGEASDPSPISDPDSESYRLLSRTVRQIFPDALVVPTIVIAATDSRHYVSVADAVYRFLPTRLAAGDLSRMHGVDERISISNYVEIIRFYAQLIRNSAG